MLDLIVGRDFDLIVDHGVPDLSGVARLHTHTPIPSRTQAINSIAVMQAVFSDLAQHDYPYVNESLIKWFDVCVLHVCMYVPVCICM